MAITQHPTKQIFGAIITLLLTTVAGAHINSTRAAETIEYTAQDLKVDTAIAVYFEQDGGQSQPYYFSLSGALVQMVVCKVTLDSHRSRILAALRSHPDFRHRDPVAAACARTDQTPLSPFAQ